MTDLSSLYPDTRWQIGWSTDEPADSLIRWGTSSGNLSQTVSDSALVLSHALELTNLNRKTTYYFTITSKDAAGNSATSPLQSFTTSGKPSKAGGAQASQGSTLLTWNLISGASQIRIFRAPGHTEVIGNLIATLPGTATSYRDPIEASSPYTYAIVVTTTEGESSDPTYIVFTPTERVKTSAPTGFSLASHTRGAPHSQAGGVEAGSNSVFIRDLTLGMSGEDVLALQRLLNARGFILVPRGLGSPGNETNYFGPATKNALMRFQQAHAAELGIARATGLLDRATRERIASLAPAASISRGAPLSRTLYLGMGGEDVRTLQKLLNAHGFTVAASGPGAPGSETTYFGPATRSALMRFQCQTLQVCSGDERATGYGQLGPKTRSALGGQ